MSFRILLLVEVKFAWIVEFQGGRQIDKKLLKKFMVAVKFNTRRDGKSKNESLSRLIYD